MVSLNGLEVALATSKWYFYLSYRLGGGIGNGK